MGKVPHGLSQPLRLGRVMAKNRIWQSPLWTRTASAYGEVTDYTIAHFASRARGGAGLITQEATAVDPRHTWHEPQLRIDDDKFAPGLRRLVEAVHAYNVPIICQLHHAGMFGNDPVSPSGVACFNLGAGSYIQPRVLTVSEIEEIRDLFITAAVRAKRIGYDGVELHGSTAYLLEQFFSPHNNKRTDKYGGSLEGRMLLTLEIIRGIREKCGSDFVLGYTSVDTDLVPGGICREDNIALARAMEQAGLTYLDLQTDGTYETFHLKEATGGTPRQPRGQFNTAEVYKQVLKIPVTTRGAGENDPDVWNEAVERGAVDAVRLGRQFLADPDMASKALSGQKDEIRPCIRCGNCLHAGVMTNWNLSCTVNPGLCNGEFQIAPAPVAKKVLVIGGGPAGLEAARTAALRGHSVKLLEKKAHLGGNLYIGSLPVGKEDLMLYVTWAEKQCNKLGVAIKLNTEATQDMVDELKPDVIFVATGSTPLVPPIPGVDKQNVVTAADVLLGKVSLGNNVVVAGGGEVGIETADLIIEKGLAKSVTIVEMLPDVGMDMSPLEKGFLFANVFPPMFFSGQLRILTNTKIKEITNTGLHVTGKDLSDYVIEADNVVMALGYVSNKKLFEQLDGYGAKVYVIGDAAQPRKIWNAIHQGNNYARQI
jgi:2,4-dienoyl-CoA reductase-like NADH-dependent reductase (Old Yellow Enzyme family)/thioredoxin reductase